ncbi:VanW family protein [Evansella sp. LMS18]|jgi:vancomycin resistance protein YoaR|uniref:VanW family protein n=1 Tax=Evansella sp. LMS18 TaxID=2924033 RepID=UPI0020D16018|nr:VanW family protein [Evansella sp. LMS18]UTR09514.1 VanW family protein [Evansella sp. LMS18]
MKYFSLFIFAALLQLNTGDDSIILTHEGNTLATVAHTALTSDLLGGPHVDENKFEEFLVKLDSQVYKEPVNAKIDQNGRIIGGKTGYKLDKQAFSETFLTYLYRGEGGKIEVPKLVIHPKVDSELLANLHVRQLSAYVTYFNVKNEERSQNIALAAEALDSHVVFPGEVFSFNETVGERTVEKGYLPAPVIVKGELYEGVGGGICQVSSTLFNAVDKAGVQILQRYSHSRRVSYVPPGRDAAVSWYGPDFTFRNIHNQPVLIRASVTGNTLLIRIFSSDVINYERREVPSAPKLYE